MGTLPLEQHGQGVWSVYLPGDQHGHYYTFTVEVDGTASVSYTHLAVVNIVLDPIFIFGYCGEALSGTTGAAAATVIGQFCGAGMTPVSYTHLLWQNGAVSWNTEILNMF